MIQVGLGFVVDYSMVTHMSNQPYRAIASQSLEDLGNKQVYNSKRLVVDCSMATHIINRIAS